MTKTDYPYLYGCLKVVGYTIRIMADYIPEMVDENANAKSLRQLPWSEPTSIPPLILVLSCTPSSTYTVEWEGTGDDTRVEIDLYYCGSFCTEVGTYEQNEDRAHC